MASVTLTINGGVSPYSISIKKLGDNTERYVSYIGSTLSFNASPENNNVTYVVTVTDSVGCSQNNTFALNCAVVVPYPTFNSILIQPECKPDLTYEPAKLQLTNILNTTRWKICYNSISFDCGDCTISDGVITGSSQTIVLSTPTVPTSRFFIARFYNGPGCEYYKEVSGTIITPECGIECNISTTLGIPTC